MKFIQKMAFNSIILAGIIVSAPSFAEGRVTYENDDFTFVYSSDWRLIYDYPSKLESVNKKVNPYNDLNLKRRVRITDGIAECEVLKIEYPELAHYTFEQIESDDDLLSAAQETYEGYLNDPYHGSASEDFINGQLMYRLSYMVDNFKSQLEAAVTYKNGSLYAPACQVERTKIKSYDEEFTQMLNNFKLK